MRCAATFLYFLASAITSGVKFIAVRGETSKGLAPELLDDVEGPEEDNNATRIKIMQLIAHHAFLALRILTLDKENCQQINKNDI